MLKIPQSAIRVKRHTTQIPSICRAFRAVKSYMLHNFGLRRGGCDFAGAFFQIIIKNFSEKQILILKRLLRRGIN